MPVNYEMSALHGKSKKKGIKTFHLHRQILSLSSNEFYEHSFSQRRAGEITQM